MKNYTDDYNPQDLLGHRLDIVRNLLERTEMSTWARTYWIGVERSLQRKWTASILNITSGTHVSYCF